MIIRFSAEADAELTEARQWYSHQRKDLDLEFMQCLDDALSRLVKNPYFFLSFTKACDGLLSDDFHSLCSMKLHPMKFRWLRFSILGATQRYGRHE